MEMTSPTIVHHESFTNISEDQWRNNNGKMEMIRQTVIVHNVIEETLLLFV